MKFNTYQKITIVEAAEIAIPEEVKELVRKKQPQTFHGGKIRFEAAIPNAGTPEIFTILFPQDSAEVTLEEGDYLVKTPNGLKGVKKLEFEDEFGIIEEKQDEVKEEKPNKEKKGKKEKPAKETK